MSFRFTPGCCCNKCKPCEEIVRSGEYRPKILVGDIDGVIDRVKDQTGLDCQYGCLAIYGVDPDGLFVIGGDTGALQPLYCWYSHFDSLTGKTELDANNSVVWDPARDALANTPEELKKNSYLADCSWLATWRKCGTDYGILTPYNLIKPSCSISLEDFSFDSLALKTARDRELPRNEGESIEDWVSRAIAGGYTYATWDLNVAINVEITYSLEPFDTSLFPNQFHRQLTLRYLITTNYPVNVEDEAVPLPIGYNGNIVRTRHYAVTRWYPGSENLSSYNDLQNIQADRIEQTVGPRVLFIEQHQSGIFAVDRLWAQDD